MGAFYRDIQEAAEDAASVTGLPIEPQDLNALVKFGLMPAFPASAEHMMLRPHDVRRFAACVDARPHIAQLFPEIFPIPSHRRNHPTSGSHDGVPSPADTVLLFLSRRMALSFTPDSIKPDVLQRFIHRIRMERIDRDAAGKNASRGPSALHHRQLTPALSAWTPSRRHLELLGRLWDNSLCPNAETTSLEQLTTANLYGSKSRLTSFLAGTVRSYLPDGAKVLDLMSGSGAVSRKLAACFDVFANDANEFAVTLTRCQQLSVSRNAVDKFLARCQPHFEENATRLEAILSSSLEREAKYLHGEVDDRVMLEYEHFSRDFPACYGSREEVARRAELLGPDLRRECESLAGLVYAAREDPRTTPYCMTTAYYANAYFGLRQSIDIDSIRYAIDKAAVNENLRVMCLGALLLTCMACASGPHFAQPFRISSQGAMCELIEHRARNVFSEYGATLSLVQKNQLDGSRLVKTWLGDWRDALQKFDEETRRTHSRRKAVYVDPPYTKLQYSRYYHVLNELLSYKYPVCSGVGRYPPRSERFSSRFEFQPASALREFRELIKTCAGRGLLLLVSYSDKGLVPVVDLVREMENAYPIVDAFTKPTRHHSQGRRLSARQNVIEYVLVGTTHLGER